MSSPKTPPPAGTSSGIQLSRDADLLIQNFIPSSEELKSSQPPPYSSDGANRLPLPLCIPQIKASYDAAFARGYNTVLADIVGISQSQLLSFIDGLNLAIVASPPLRVVDTIGKVIGFVPYHWAMIAGAVIQTVAQTGMHVLSKTLTDRYLRAANLNVFKPRGLSVRLCTTAAMQKLVVASDSSPTGQTSTLTKVGRVAGTVLLKLPLPFSSRIVRAIADKPTKIAPSQGSAKDVALLRRLALVDGYALPLDLDMPPPEKPRGAMDTMGSWGVKFDAYMAGRKEKKTEERRRLLARTEAGAASGNYQMQVMGSRRERKAARRSARRARGSEGLLSGLIGPRETPLQRRVANADLAEHWATEKIVWIVVMSAENDREIQGIEIAESQDNEERVDNDAWREEIALERREMEDAYELESESDSETDTPRKIKTTET